VTKIPGGCRHGNPVGFACGDCRASQDALIADFWRGVFFGEWDRDGYTPADRRHAARAPVQAGPPDTDELQPD
jgi:hypothetical protein